METDSEFTFTHIMCIEQRPHMVSFNNDELFCSYNLKLRDTASNERHISSYFEAVYFINSGS